MTSLRNANWESTEGGIVARHPPGTDPLAPGEAATIDFTAEGPAQTPDSCSLNGDACSL
ncbi:hypothetical protein [Allosalinactinospora lopnorensis]|uniref:hypothetical protein n=1 Tax=Allosalinactinospora lopnorensis TaxID=1352348 RepID=UPI0030841583